MSVSTVVASAEMTPSYTVIALDCLSISFEPGDRLLQRGGLSAETMRVFKC